MSQYTANEGITSTASTVERTSQIQVQMDRYESLTSRLAGDLEELEKRLSPVLLQSSPAAVNEDREGVEQSTTASKLSGINNTLDDQIDRLSALIARIDL